MTKATLKTLRLGLLAVIVLGIAGLAFFKHSQAVSKDVIYRQANLDRGANGPDFEKHKKLLVDDSCESCTAAPE